MKAYPPFISLFLLLFILLSICSCEDENEPVMAERSELALFMREMTADVERMQADIAAGTITHPEISPEAILTSEATEPEKAASDEFKAFADSYLHMMEHFDSSSPESSKASYDKIISTCTNCHQAMCPGPLVVIDRLR